MAPAAPVFTALERAPALGRGPAPPDGTKSKTVPFLRATTRIPPNRTDTDSSTALRLIHSASEPAKRKSPDSSKRLLAPDHEINGRYRILEHLGSGGVGDAYRALDLTLRRQVVLKVWRKRTGRRSFSRLQPSLAKWAKLRHPSLLRIFDVSEGDLAFVVMEYLEGRSLRQFLIEQENLKPEQVIRFGIEICEGLEEMHSHGIFHQDIKPENLIVGSDGHIRIIDFDIIGSSWNGATPGYASPEQELASGSPTAASDLFSLGCVLYEAITGQRAFSRKGISGERFSPPPLLGQSDLFPPNLAQVVGSCLKYDPQARPQNAFQFKRMLERLPLAVKPWVMSQGTARTILRGDDESPRLSYRFDISAFDASLVLGIFITSISLNLFLSGIFSESFPHHLQGGIVVILGVVGIFGFHTFIDHKQTRIRKISEIQAGMIDQNLLSKVDNQVTNLISKRGVNKAL